MGIEALLLPPGAVLPPGMLLILGALLIPWLPRRLGQAWMLLLPALSLAQLWNLPLEASAAALGGASVFGIELDIVRIDPLARLWGTIFHIAAFISVIYSLHVTDRVQHVAGLMYAGAAIGAVFAGDLITLFVYWELTALTSVFLVWASRTERALRSGTRYLIVQVGSGVLLLAGIVLRAHETGSVAFDALGGVHDPATTLIFIAFGIKAAFPFLHNWLQDAYPEATVTGTVWLGSFTTKLAIYALARGFPGEELLIPIGVAMAAFPIFFAVIENDLRRVLAYSLNNQLGFMVVGVGIGTAASINGAAAHAFAHILYKALLFMSMGAVLFRTGTAKGSELGGLYKSMPWTCAFCIIGAASISAFPLTSGFISKSIILAEATNAHLTLTFLILLFASAGVFHHSGIKIPYFAFFAHDAGIRVKEAPLNMLVAMGITATLCILIGIFPERLYAILPHQPVEFVPYTIPHVVTQLQLLMWSALAFGVLNWYRMYPPELRSTNLDFDWFYRRLGPSLFRWYGQTIEPARLSLVASAQRRLIGFGERVHRYHGPGGLLARTSSTGGMALGAVIFLAMLLLLSYN
jgi:multicomponent Na+:H+ antiporter subunit D